MSKPERGFRGPTVVTITSIASAEIRNSPGTLPADSYPNPELSYAEHLHQLPDRCRNDRWPRGIDRDCNTKPSAGHRPKSDDNCRISRCDAEAVGRSRDVDASVYHQRRWRPAGCQAGPRPLDAESGRHRQRRCPASDVARVYGSTSTETCDGYRAVCQTRCSCARKSDGVASKILGRNVCGLRS